MLATRERHSHPSILTSALVVLGMTLTAAHAAAQVQGHMPGDVLDQHKISDTVGGFPAGLENNDELGFSMATLGDIDGDGFGDVAVGAHLDDDGGLNRGAVYVLRLNGQGGVKASTKISSGSGGFTGVLDDSDEFGYSLTSLGDLDGAGPSVVALAVGAKDDDDGGRDQGAVWILFLDATGGVLSHAKISGTEGGFTGDIGSDDEFGRAVSSLGDFDGDGVNDLAVGARNDDDGGTNRGAVYLLLLDADGSVKDTAKISSLAGGFGGALSDNDEFGSALATLGDLDGDGIVDLAVGARGDDDGALDAGAVWLVFLEADGSVKGQSKISATAGGFTGVLDADDRFGESLGALGDFDGDTHPDLAVGAPRDDDGGPGRGAVWIVFLEADGTTSGQVKVSDTASAFDGVLGNDDRFGSAITSLGDLDGDGVHKIAIGAPRDDDGGGNRGALYVAFIQGPPEAVTFLPPTQTQFQGLPGQPVLMPQPPVGEGDDIIGEPIVVVPRTSSNTVSVQHGQDGPGGQGVQFTPSVGPEPGTGPGPVEVGTATWFDNGLMQGDGGAGGFQPADLITANFLGDSISVLENLGDNTFAPHVEIPLPAPNGSPVGLAVGDFDNDGQDDVAVAGRAGVTVFLGDGLGGFSAITFTPVALLTDIAAAHVDDDGNLDLVTGSGREVEAGEDDEGFATVLLGQGDGTFVVAGTFGGGAAVAAVLLGDVTGDERVDALLSIHRFEDGNGVPLGELQLFVNDPLADGGQPFVPSPVFGGYLTPSPEGIHPTFGSLGDFDDDGFVDALYTSSDNIARSQDDFGEEQPPVRLTVLRNDTAGGFEVQEQGTAYVGKGRRPLPSDIILDPDQNTDAVLVWFGDTQAGLGQLGAQNPALTTFLTVLEGTGEAGFVDPAPNQFATGDTPGDGDIIDIDPPQGDADTLVRNDILVPNMLDNSFSVLFGDGQGGVQLSVEVGGVDDFDPDAVAGDWVGGPRTLRVGDITGNGKLDVALYNEWERTDLPGDGETGPTVAASLSLYTTNGLLIGQAQRVQHLPLARGGEMDRGLLDDDLFGDVVVTQRIGNGGADAVHVHAGRIDSTIEVLPEVLAVPAGRRLSGGLMVVDLTGDERLDILTTVLDADGADGAGGGALLVYENLVGGGYAATLHELGGTWLEVRSLDLGDFNDDGHTDVAIGSRNGRLFLAKGSAGGAFTALATNPGAALVGGGALRVVDLNGDGRDDILSSNATDDGVVDQAFVRALIRNGNAIFNIPPVGGLASTGIGGPRRPLASELDNDGAVDIVLVHGTSDRVSVLVNQLSAFETFGPGKAGTFGITPTLAGAGYSTPGGEVTLSLANGLGGAPALFMLGVGESEHPWLAVESVLVQVPLTLGGPAGVPGAGTLALAGSIPMDPAAVGVTLTFQVLVGDAGAVASPPGIAASNGLAMTIVQ